MFSPHRNELKLPPTGIAVALTSKDAYDQWWAKRLTSAGLSGGEARLPRTVKFPRGNILVIKGLPGEFKVDTDQDCYR